MGTNNLVQIGTITPVAATGDTLDQYLQALGADIVPRNSSGVVVASAGDLGTLTYPFKTLYSNHANISSLTVGYTKINSGVLGNLKILTGWMESLTSSVSLDANYSKTTIIDSIPITQLKTHTYNVVIAQVGIFPVGELLHVYRDIGNNIRSNTVGDIGASFQAYSVTCEGISETHYKIYTEVTSKADGRAVNIFINPLVRGIE